MTYHHPDAPLAFLRAVCERPDDDLPRSIFADWLDERGDPLGEFVRVQVELAKLPEQPETCRPSLRDGRPEKYHANFCPFCQWVENVRPRADALRRRERELLKRWWTDWMPPAHETWTLNWACYNIDGDSVGPPSITFRRGFVDEVRMGWNREHIAAIRQATPLRKVVLTTWPEMEGPMGYDVRYRLRGCEETIPEGAFAVGSRGYPELMIPQLLAAEFGSVEFELPPAQRPRDEGSWGRAPDHADAVIQYGVPNVTDWPA